MVEPDLGRSAGGYNLLLGASDYPEVRLLWTQRALHHSSRDMNIVSRVRFGPLEGIWSLIAHIPLAFMGFPPEAIVLGVISVLAFQTWLHTELIGKLGPLEGVLNTPYEI